MKTQIKQVGDRNVSIIIGTRLELYNLCKGLTKVINGKGGALISDFEDSTIIAMDEKSVKEKCLPCREKCRLFDLFISDLIEGKGVSIKIE